MGLSRCSDLGTEQSGGRSCPPPSQEQPHSSGRCRQVESQPHQPGKACLASLPFSSTEVTQFGGGKQTSSTNGQSTSALCPSRGGRGPRACTPFILHGSDQVGMSANSNSQGPASPNEPFHAMSRRTADGSDNQVGWLLPPIFEEGRRGHQPWTFSLPAPPSGPAMVWGQPAGSPTRELSHLLPSPSRRDAAGGAAGQEPGGRSPPVAALWLHCVLTLLLSWPNHASVQEHALYQPTPSLPAAEPRVCRPAEGCGTCAGRQEEAPRLFLYQFLNQELQACVPEGSELPLGSQTAAVIRCEFQCTLPWKLLG